MILIFSEESDKSTDLVIDWLLKFKAKFIRVCRLPILSTT
jgi:hypothetical protein